MTSISNKAFIEFLEYYAKNPKYIDTITEISWPKNKKGETDRRRNPLIENSFQMLSLDDICKECSKFDQYNRPSTTDALWYNLTDNGDLILYFIEFKWHNLDYPKDQQLMEDTFLKLERKTEITTDMKDKFKKLYRSYSDEDVSFKLRLKPFESLFVVLPILFEDYCEKNNKDLIGLNNFLKTCEIKVFSFVSTFTRENESQGYKNNKSKNRLKFNRIMGPKGSIGRTVWKQYKRLELSPLIDFADIYPKSFFETFLIDEGLENQ